MEKKLFILSIFLLILINSYIGLSDLYSSNWSANESQISQYKNVKFSALWQTSNSTLDSYIFSINNGSGFVNSSLLTFNNSTNGTSYYIFYIVDSPNTNLSWQFWAKDSENNWNYTPIQSFIIKDSISPTFLQNSFYANESVGYSKKIRFYSNWTDNDKIDTITFVAIIDQASNNYVPTITYFNSTNTYMAYYDYYIDSNINTLNWQFLANDSSNNWNFTPLYTYQFINNSVSTNNSVVDNSTVLKEFYKQAKNFEVINPGVEALFQPNKSQFDIYKILISVRTTVNNVTITLENLNTLENISYIPSNLEVYSYYGLHLNNLKKSDLRYLNIEFSVPKQFLIDNNIKSSKVAIYSLNDKLMPLITEYKGQDSSKAYYSSTVYEDSYLVIAAEKELSESVQSNGTQTTSSYNTQTTIYNTQQTKNSSSVLIWIVSSLIILVILSYFLLKKLNKKH